MRKLVIAVDCDDVLVRTTPYFVDAYNRIYGTNVTLANAHYDDEVIWRADRTTLEGRFAELMKTKEYEALRPSEAEAEVLMELAVHHELHVITARREHERALTQLMVDTYLPNVFTSLELVGYSGSKGRVCERINAEVLIDDNLRHLEDALKYGLPSQGAILFGDYPWNAEPVSLAELKRCASWMDVRKEIDELAR